MRVLVALGVSAAVHGALVVAAARPPPPVKRGPPVEELATVVEVFEAAAPMRRDRPVELGTAVEVFEAPGAVPRAVEVKGAAEVKGLPAVTAEAPAVPAAEGGDDVGAVATEPAVAEATGAGAAEAPVAAPAEAGPPVRGIDVRALHAALAASAQRCYPAAAKRYRLTGEATVDFCLDAAGALASAKLASSTGQSLLDDAARECVIAGALPLPREAAGGCYQVPVRFGAR